jgi:hypothetical protein
MRFPAWESKNLYYSYSTSNNPGITSPALPSTTFVKACAFSGGSGPM